MKIASTLKLLFLSICLLVFLFQSPTLIGGAKHSSGFHSSFVSPNPSKSTANISYDAAEPGTFHLEVFDLIGNKVLRQKAREKGKFTFNVSDLENGVYFYFILNEEGWKSR